MKFHDGELSADDFKIGIVISRFNDFITEKLLGGAEDCLVRHGADSDSIDVYRVPGAFEVPQFAKTLVESGKFDGVICLGAVIRGDTPHFDYVASEASKGIAKVALDSDVPVVYGVLTTDTVEQAIERAGTKAGNRGFDAAMSLIEMINLKKEI